MSNEKKLQKYNFDGLYLEITRKCNLRCEHCLCGEPQDITITKEIIDAFLSQVSVIGRLTLGGGEPFLELDMIEYLLKALVDREVPVLCINVIHNGTIFDERIMDIFSDYLAHNPICEINLAFSHDVFHDPERSEACLEFYKKNACDRINLSLHVDIDALRDSGRSKGKKSVKGIPVNVIPLSSIRQHRINVCGQTIKCELELTATGNLCISSETSFDERDRLALGNVLNNSIYEIIQNNQANCPYLCDECYSEILASDYEKFHEIKTLQDERDAFRLKIAKQHIHLVWKLREWAFKKFPNVKREAIIMGTIFPDSEFAEYITNHLVTAYKAVNKLKISDEEASQRISLEAYLKYSREIKKQFPSASVEDITTLSLEKFMCKAIDLMNVNDFKLALFQRNSPEGFFLSIEQILKNKDVNLDEFDPCAKIPDTMDKDEGNKDDDK